MQSGSELSEDGFHQKTFYGVITSNVLLVPIIY